MYKRQVHDSGGPISVPVGNVTLGHVFNTTGECLNLEPGEKLEITERWGIHRSAPAFDQLESKTVMFETGLKAVSYTHLDVYKRQASSRRSTTRR